jgi:ATP-dependent DNA helicase RecG
MRDAMLNHGLDAPTSAEQDGYFVLTFPGPNGNYDRPKVPAQASLLVPPSVEAQLSDRQRNMAAMLAKVESLTSKVCQQQFKVSGPAIYADFQTLIRLVSPRGLGLAVPPATCSDPKPNR